MFEQLWVKYICESQIYVSLLILGTARELNVVVGAILVPRIPKFVVGFVLDVLLCLE